MINNSFDGQLNLNQLVPHYLQRNVGPQRNLDKKLMQKKKRQFWKITSSHHYYCKKEKEYERGVELPFRNCQKQQHKIED